MSAWMVAWVPLDGEWEVARTGGLLPPLRPLVRKRIAGGRGWTTLGPVRLPFDVVGSELRYRFPLVGIVDEVVEERPDEYRGEARLFGRTVGTFRMTRRSGEGR